MAHCESPKFIPQYPKKEKRLFVQGGRIMRLDQENINKDTGKIKLSYLGKEGEDVQELAKKFFFWFVVPLFFVSSWNYLFFFKTLENRKKNCIKPHFPK